MKQKSTAQKIALSGVLIAFAVIFGTFSIPFGAARLSPLQSFVNVVGAIVLGPVYALANAFIAALIRNILGVGTLLAFPGSIIGAGIAGIFYVKLKKLIAAVIGEVIGTGIIGAIVAYPVARFLIGKDGAVYAFVIPFALSSIFGGIIAYLFLRIPVITKVLVDNQDIRKPLKKNQVS